ncbi:F-box protein CPR1-like [Solanum verrucosum]|uniref:F-box protein CPR1-like n=1 Tax=Solanum verrucosum TaxID=315347 RepID=UPI0020D11B75|nr:F-box protein CPR1-like [Solanum verrucosum]
MATNNGEDFPEDLIREILLRLPVKSLLRFKRICKNWYTLIKNPSFIREHLNFSKNNPPQLLIYDYGAPGDFPPITFISDYGIDAPTHEVNPQSFEGMTNLLGSLDGLFFLEREINNDVLCALWNPATREVRDLLSAVGIKFESFFNSNQVFGFGLDVLTNDYKVVYYNCKNKNATVYSCSRDSWRIFKHENVCDNRNVEYVDTFYGSTTYLNGSYYWMLRKNINFNFTFKFLSFNFGNEVFEVIEGPPHDCAIRSWTADLMILDGSIVILNEVDMFIYYVWFKQKGLESAEGRLSKLRQITTVSDLQGRFEAIANDTDDISDRSMLHLFISGLREDIKNSVLNHEPKTFDEALK